LGRRKADAARTAGDDGNTAFAQRGMLRHCMLLLRMGLVQIGPLDYNSGWAFSWHATGWPPGSITPIFDPSFFDRSAGLSR
ncbi:MAG TPA: hypothetical protein VHT21_05935, partial [Stellaceae bacterium]|nr:hypothetical protein [Stellaceae bacterium]